MTSFSTTVQVLTIAKVSRHLTPMQVLQTCNTLLCRHFEPDCARFARGLPTANATRPGLLHR